MPMSAASKASDMAFINALRECLRLAPLRGGAEQEPCYARFFGGQQVAVFDAYDATRNASSGHTRTKMNWI